MQPAPVAAPGPEWVAELVKVFVRQTTEPPLASPRLTPRRRCPPRGQRAGGHARAALGPAVLALLAVLPTGCGSTPPTLDLLLTAPVEVRTRSDVPDCGVELVGRGGPWNLEARSCFWDAYVAGKPAEFITTRPSGGGKPLVVIFRILGPGSVEFFADESAIYGEPVWTWTTCPGFTATDDPGVPVDWVPGLVGADGAADACGQRQLGEQLGASASRFDGGAMQHDGTLGRWSH